MIKFLPLGGANEIGANSYYLDIEGTGIILDCGMHPQKLGLDSLPNFDLIADRPVDFVLISHAHLDHLGSLPYLVQRHPYIKIITTPQTRAIAELTLHNSVSILKEQLSETDEIKIYSHAEIDLLIQSIAYHNYKEEFELEGYNGNCIIKASFHDAGHILGSAGIMLEFDGKKLFYTGDINLSRQSLIDKAELPHTKVDILLLESTYGSIDTGTIPLWNKEGKRLATEANKIIGEGGSVLIPVFSLGKHQEILSTIWNLMESGSLAKTDIYTGGIGPKISRIYDYNRYAVNRTDKEFELWNIPQKNLFDVMNYEGFFRAPSIVLASSGMLLPGTVSFNLAQYWLKKANAAIFTVGYMEENTPGYIVSNSSNGEKIKLTNTSENEIVKCRIKKFRFSSHAVREQLMDVVKKLNPSEVVIVHGDPPSVDWVGGTILREYEHMKVYAAEPGKELAL